MAVAHGVVRMSATQIRQSLGLASIGGCIGLKGYIGLYKGFIGYINIGG